MMSDERRYWFVIDKGKLEYVQDNVTNEKITISELEDLLNEQQKFIDLLFNELLNAQKQGYVLNCTHQMERCSLIPKEIENE